MELITHAVERAMERYSINYLDIFHITEGISQKQNIIWERKLYQKRSFLFFSFRGEKIPIIFNWRVGRIVTFLPKESIADWEEHQKRENDMLEKKKQQAIDIENYMLEKKKQQETDRDNYILEKNKRQEVLFLKIKKEKKKLYKSIKCSQKNEWLQDSRFFQYIGAFRRMGTKYSASDLMI